MNQGPTRFWLLQGAGWLAFAVAMALSRLGVFPLGFMVVAKSVLALLGLLASLAIRPVYRRMLRRGDVGIGRVVVASVVCSYLAALVWSAAANLLDVPLYAWLLDRRISVDTPVRLFGGSVYHAFALLAWSLCYFAVKHHDALAAERERSLRAEALAQRARLEALRYQLNPHFLFNALNAVSTLVAERRNDEASRMLARVSDFLRLTLAAGATAQETSLADEVEYVRRYLEIEQVRFGRRLAVRYDVDDAVRDARVPSLILQPLIENAVRHAIAPREEGGTIELSARRVANGHGDALRLTVADDGPGLAADAPDVTPDGARRIGLANTRERLRALYGDRQRLEVAESSAGGGVRVTIELPLSPPP